MYKVKITEYDGNIIIETINRNKDEYFTPIGNGRCGNTLKNTYKYLAMSNTARDIIYSSPISGDDIGIINMYNIYNNDKKIGVFSWIGPIIVKIPYHVIDLPYCGIQDIEFIEIKNETSQWLVNELKK